MANPLVVDISHHQGDPIDWDALKAGGTVGVIHKATEGTSYVDDKLFERARAAMDAGLKWSTYHFLRDSDPEEQMQHYLDTIDPVQGERVCIDHEDDDVTLEQLKDCVTYILDNRPDLQVTIYSGHLIKDQLPNTVRDEVLAGTSLWIAHYTGASAPTWPTGTWPTWSLWQYTDSENVSGFEAPVDGDRWNGSEDALLKWFGPAGEEPQPAPEPQPPVAGEVNVRIVYKVEAPEGVTVKVTAEDWDDLAHAVKTHDT